MLDPNEGVLRELKKAGSDLTKPHPTEFYLYLGTREAAEAAGAELMEASFDVVVRPAAEGKGWLCLAKKHIIPTLFELKQIEERLSIIAGSFGGEYDGWEAEVVK